MERLARHVDRFPDAQRPLTAASPWRPTPFIAGSIALHGLAVLGAVAAPRYWPWALGAVVADQLAIGAAGLLPRMHWIGRNITRLPAPARARREVTLTFDDGPDPEVTPRVLDLLERRGVRGTFFCIGTRVRRYPDLCREIARRGHDVENHSLEHPPTFSIKSLDGYREQVGAAQALIGEVTGRTPRFFRAPMGFRNPLLDPVLHEMGLQLVAWTRRGFDTAEPKAEVVARRLLRNLGPGDILLLHDGHAARTPRGEPVVLEVLPRLLDAFAERGLKPTSLPEALEP